MLVHLNYKSVYCISRYITSIISLKVRGGLGEAKIDLQPTNFEIPSRKSHPSPATATMPGDVAFHATPMFPWLSK